MLVGGEPMAPEKDTKDRLVCLGRVGRPHGVRGEVKLQFHHEAPATLVAGAEVFLVSTDGAIEPAVVGGLRFQGPMGLLLLQGVSNRTAAERLRGKALAVRRRTLPDPGPDAYYVCDLVGLRAEDASGKALGTVSGSYFHGGHEVLVVDGGVNGVREVPFTEDHAREVDLHGGRIVFDPLVWDLPVIPRRKRR